MKTPIKTMTLDEFVKSIEGKCLIRTSGGQLYGNRDYCRESREEITSWEECMTCQGVDPEEIAD